MPWGNKPDVNVTAKSSEKEEEIIIDDSQPAVKTKIIINIPITPIIVWTTALLTIIIIFRRYKKKYYSPTQQQRYKNASCSIQIKHGFSEHRDTETSAESAHKETAHPMYESQQEVSEMTEEMNNLKMAYQRLEMRLNKCTYPMQAGLNKLAVASSKRCSQLNEGGVTTADYI
jgi:flagellar basal body rod protein FlgB